jgi:glycosyltransferase involved in cell wall biosynthesis
MEHMKYKIVGGVTTKDEEWIIEKTLGALDRICDSIIVYDDGSTDKTEEISRSFKKVDWHVRPKHNPLKREEAKQRLELINLLRPQEPDYVILLDADEILTPSIIPFLDKMDDSTTWKIRQVQLWTDEDHYRTDQYDPFITNFHGKYPLFKFDPTYPYTYNLNVQKGGCSPYHPAPTNLPGKISTTDDFYLIHYGMIGDFYTSGEKHKFYAQIESLSNRGTYQQRLNHHIYHKRMDNLKTTPVKREWFWNDIK